MHTGFANCMDSKIFTKNINRMCRIFCGLHKTYAHFSMEVVVATHSIQFYLISIYFKSENVYVRLIV